LSAYRCGGADGRRQSPVVFLTPPVWAAASQPPVNKTTLNTNITRAGFKNTSYHFGGSPERSSRDKTGKNPRCSAATTPVFARLILRISLRFPPKLTERILETSSS
jgi:hypothetical protein